MLQVISASLFLMLQLPMPSTNHIRKATANKVFTELQRSGPLCASQISVNLALRITKVNTALNDLWAQGIVELSTNPNHPVDAQLTEGAYEDPWRIRFRGKKIRLKRTEALRSFRENREEIA